MKSLGEVISKVEATWVCPTDDEYCEMLEVRDEVLHYLKEYRDKHDEMLKMEEALGYCEMADNRPLTWDELREMKHKPVWVETTLTEDKKMKTWYLICGIDDSFIWVADAYGGQHNFPRVCLDTNIWKAYRKERA